MKIVREVNGTSMEFELSKDELFGAYQEQEHIWDANYICNEFSGDERFDGMTDAEREAAYSEIAWDYRKTADKVELGLRDDYEIASQAVDGYFEEKGIPNTWITVYKDALGYLDNVDNLTDILVPAAWLLEKLKAEGETDIEGWYSEYTADSTDMIAREAVSEGVILSCADKRISCVLGLAESFLGVNEYGKALAAHMREIYLEEHAHYGAGDVGTEFIEHRVTNIEEAAGWCLLTYGDRALCEIQHEWIEGDKVTDIFGFDALAVRDVLALCITREREISLDSVIDNAVAKACETKAGTQERELEI